MDRKKQIEKEILELRTELNAITDAEDAPKEDALVGKCFKYRNNYSMPEMESDYWWLYAKIIAKRPDGGLHVFQFQTDKDGKITIEPDDFHVWQHFDHGYIEIMQLEFSEAFRELVERMVGFSNDQ